MKNIIEKRHFSEHFLKKSHERVLNWLNFDLYSYMSNYQCMQLFIFLLSVISLVPIQIKFDYNNISFVKNRLAQLSSARNRQLREVWSFTFMEGPQWTFPENIQCNVVWPLREPTQIPTKQQFSSNSDKWELQLNSLWFPHILEGEFLQVKCLKVWKTVLLCPY